MTIELTKEIEDHICEELATGRSLISISRDKGIPSCATIYRWMKTYPEFAISIARARDDQADYFFDKQIEFAEEATTENYMVKKFQADQLKWVAGRLKPKKYGERLNLDHSGELALTTKEQRDAAVAAALAADS